MLLSLSCRRCFAPASLMLGALFALSTLADPPAVPGVPVAMPQTIVLQHTLPADIIKLSHWNQPAHLPAGVTQIQSLPAQNALSVTATPAGLAKMREIVKILDIEPRQVQIKPAFAHASAADLKASGVDLDLVPLNASPSGAASKSAFVQYAAGSAAARFLETLTKQRAVAEGPVITTTNNTYASFSLSAPAHSQEASLDTFDVTPRINSDNSVTLALHSVFSDGTAKREIRTLRTVRNGETLVIVIPPAASAAGGKSLLLFVTPTVLPDAAGSSVKSFKVE